MTTPKTHLEILRGARDLVAAGWTQGAFGRTHSGMPMGYAGANIANYCALGALFRAGSGSGPLPTKLAEIAVRNQVNGSLVIFNDTPGRTQAEVVAVYDKAIAAAEASQ
jgi:hypothetical protein